MVNVTVHAPMSLQRYPYDRHVVPFCLDSRVTIDAQGKKIKWKLCKEWPKWAPTKWPEDKMILSEQQTTPDLEYSHKRCFAYLHRYTPDSYPAHPVVRDRDPYSNPRANRSALRTTPTLMGVSEYYPHHNVTHTYGVPWYYPLGQVYQLAQALLEGGAV